MTGTNVCSKKPKEIHRIIGERGVVIMGLFFNPGNDSFRIKRNDDYIDKSGMISIVNESLCKKDKLSCVSRPRRFGKTYATAMLAAYYDNSCDSHSLFDDLAIAKDPGYGEHLNKYNVMYLDMSYFISISKDRTHVVECTQKQLADELVELYPDLVNKDMTISKALATIVEASGAQFVAIIDEWDAPLRDSDATAGSKKEYLEFLRSFFKNTAITDKVFAGAYMTGILPIKKDGSQSAVSEFSEYTIFDPEQFAPYIGFTEEEVKELCRRRSLDFAQMKKWYDGYNLPGAGDMYNANSVMKAASYRKYESYWSASSAANSLLKYLNMDFEGLGDDVDDLLKDKAVRIDNSTFLNDMYELYSRDDVLTLLTHFGYLAYDAESGFAHIPNLEIRIEYYNISRRVRHQRTIDRLKECDELFKATAEMDEKKVAEGIQKVHERECSPRHYNREESLRSVIKLAYYTYNDQYLRLEEAGGGTGYADMVYIPRKYSDMPLLIIELKKDDTPENAIKQIRERNYAAPYVDMDVDILLIGVAYDSNDPAKTHRCVIEEL